MKNRANPVEPSQHVESFGTRPRQSQRSVFTRIRYSSFVQRIAKAGSIGVDFWLLWSGQTVSRLGSAISAVAVPLIAVTILKATPFEMGALAAIQSIPTLLLAVAGGVLADRKSKRMIMLVSDSGRATTLLAIGFLAATGRLTMAWLCGLMFCAAALGVFFDVSCAALVPVMVERDRLLQANTALQGARTASSLAGRSIGGVVVVTLSAPVAMYVDAVSYVISVLSIWSMRWREPRQVQETQRSSIWVDVVEGFRFARTHPYIRVLLAYAATANFSISGLFAIYVLYLSANLHLPAPQIGVVLAALASGSFVGTCITSRLTKLLGYGPSIRLTGLVASAASWVLLLDAGPGMSTMLIQCMGLAVLGISLTVINVSINVVLQECTPSRLMARIVGVTQFVCSIMLPVGALLAGAVGQYAGTKAAIAFVAATLMATALLFHLSEVSRFKTIPVNKDDPVEN